MFERRLRIILWTLMLATAALIARAGQIQLVQQARWAEAAEDLLTRHRLIETTRGSILDCKGRVLAEDEPCMDACVEYPAITEDWDANGKWLKALAMAAAERRDGQLFSQASNSRQKQMIAEEEERIRGQVRAMWHTLAVAAGQTDEQIDDLRSAIIQRVEARRQFVILQNYRKTLARQNSAKPPWYDRWWPAAQENGVVLDDSVEVAEESQAHVILPAISTEVYNQLATAAENLPGLLLRPGRQRVYPFKESACHIIGNLATVNVKSDPNADDPLRRYWPNDPAGIDGVERLCEQTLRGRRGETIQQNSGDWEARAEAKPGGNVTLSIDIELQKACEAALARPRTFVVPKLDGNVAQSRRNQPGAVVVLDLATNRALALASFPNYDLNTVKAEYAQLRKDEINDPLLDRALQAAWEPGSSVKPLMALAALTDGLITPESTIPCDGFLVIGGRRQSVGRCWTMSEFNLTHQQVPASDPMHSDQMTVADAIERSCNVYFETVADRMGMVRQRYWYDRFGLGRPTGIGLPEAAGSIPDPKRTPQYLLRMTTWFTGIGQEQVAATPLQMANAAATIARGGVWMQPRLVDDGTAGKEVDLGFSADSLAAVKEGMEAVANKGGGTGHLYQPSEDVQHLRIAAKSGTPQVSRLTIPVRDEHGNVVRHDLVDPNDPAVRDWYIADDEARTHYAHNWYIGYAPAEHPKIAFAIFAEYGGSGSPTASAIAADVLAACIKRGYLSGE